MSLSSYSLLYTDGISSNCFLLLQHRRSATEKGISFVNHVESHRFLNAGQVLSDAAQQLTQYDELLNYILGIIFLATPNFMKVTTAALIAWFRILRSSLVLTVIPKEICAPSGIIARPSKIWT